MGPVLEDPSRYFATHPVNMIYALNQSCKMILAEGLQSRFARHRKIALAFRNAMRAIGLKLLCKEEDSANTLSVPYYPDNVNDALFRASMASEYGIIVAGGVGP